MFLLASLLINFSAANVVNGRPPTRLPKSDIHALIKVGLSDNMNSRPTSNPSIVSHQHRDHLFRWSDSSQTLYNPFLSTRTRYDSNSAADLVFYNGHRCCVRDRSHPCFHLPVSARLLLLEQIAGGLLSGLSRAFTEQLCD